ncbi:MAG: hypothetical protein EB060_01820 [Proteobacteria bacterium]|nr:hypothetical protein [Pseudomonadota bacterium]
MVDLYSEIRGEVRQEKAIRFVKQNWRAILGTFIFSILMVAAGELWSNYQRGQQEKSGHAFNSAMIQLSRENNTEEALKAFDKLSDDGTASYRGLALLQKASLQLKRKKIDDAIATYKKLSDDGGISVEIRDLGTYLCAFLLYDQGKFDESEKMANPLVKKGSPWRMQALELQSYIALAKNDNKKAAEILSLIAGERDVAPTLKERAGTLLAIANAGTTASKTEPVKP